MQRFLSHKALNGLEAARRLVSNFWIRSLGAAVLILGSGCHSETQTNPQSAAPAPVIQGELIQAAAPTNTPAATSPVLAPASILSSNAVTAAATPKTSPPSKSDAKEDFKPVGFDKLSSFAFDVSDEILQSNATNATQVSAKTREQIPATVREFDQQRIALKGFMLPLKVEGGKVTEMLIMRDQSMCCYGAVPKINEWVSVRMVGEGVKPVMDQAITLYGKLHVGETRENGYLVGIYSMDGERVAGPTEN